MIIYLNLCSMKGIFGFDYYDLAAYFSHFQTNLLKKLIKNRFSTENQIFACFRPIFDFELKGKRSGAKPSQAKNPSARALARASSARTHHYYILLELP